MPCGRVYDSWSARPGLVVCQAFPRTSPRHTGPAQRFTAAARAIDVREASVPERIESMSDSPLIPERIAGLRDLATDLWWVWHRDAREVFRKLDYKVWRLTAHNPVRMLRL